MIYAKQKFYSLCNDFYREFTLHCARGWSYCHFRGEINIRCLADIFSPEGLWSNYWSHIILFDIYDMTWLQPKYHRVYGLHPKTDYSCSSMGTVFSQEGKSISLKNSWLLKITRWHYKVKKNDILGYLQSPFCTHIFKH